MIKTKLLPFSLPEESRNQIEITVTPVMITQFTGRINSLIDDSCMQKLKVASFTKWLVNNGFLCEEVVNEKKIKKPTEAGSKLGITSESKDGYFGSYLAIFYDESAQRHLVEKLDQITAISNGE